METVIKEDQSIKKKLERKGDDNMKKFFAEMAQTGEKPKSKRQKFKDAVLLEKLRQSVNSVLTRRRRKIVAKKLDPEY